MISKKHCRKNILAIRKTLTATQRHAAHQNIYHSLQSFLSDYSFRCVIGYLALYDEASIDSLLSYFLSQGVPVYVPKQLDTYSLVQLTSLDAVFPGPYSIREPLLSTLIPDAYYTDSTTLWLVPGVAFSRFGDRLGLGKGIYDRLLYKVNGLKVGIAYSSQITDPWMGNEYDISMDEICTDLGMMGLL